MLRTRTRTCKLEIAHKPCIKLLFALFKCAQYCDFVERTYTYIMLRDHTYFVHSQLYVER